MPLLHFPFIIQSTSVCHWLQTSPLNMFLLRLIMTNVRCQETRLIYADFQWSLLKLWRTLNLKNYSLLFRTVFLIWLPLHYYFKFLFFFPLLFFFLFLLFLLFLLFPLSFIFISVKLFGVFGRLKSST